MVVNIAWAAVVRFFVKDKRLFWIIMVAAFGLLVRKSLQREMYMGYTPGTFWTGTERVCFSFVAGVLLQALYRRAKPAALAPRTSVVAAAAVTALLLWTFMSPQPIAKARLFPIFAVTIVFPATIWMGGKIRLGPALSRICEVLGEISYPLYVLHHPFVMPVYGPLASWTNPANRLYRLLSPIAVLVFGALVWPIGAYAEPAVRRRILRWYKHRFGLPPGSTERVAQNTLVRVGNSNIT
jgi:peptidoglycan/LPS O-acetylase OafA/YrhL